MLDHSVEQFCSRLNQACDEHPEIPPINQGRLVFLQKALAAKLGKKVSPETVSRWLRGENVARQKNLDALSEILGVTPSWLQYGLNADTVAAPNRRTLARASGVTHILAGIAGMDGAGVAYPAEVKGGRSAIDLHLTIEGALYNVKVLLVEELKDGTLAFETPPREPDVILIGVLREGPGFSFKLFEIRDRDVQKRKRTVGGVPMVTFAPEEVGTAITAVTTLAQRL